MDKAAGILAAFFVVEEIGALACDMEAVIWRAIGRIENLRDILLRVATGGFWRRDLT